MIPSAFEYARAKSVEETVKLLRDLGSEAKVLAGGHSLIPLMRMRLAQPSVLVDINRIDDLDYVRLDQGRLHIGALTRHHQLQENELVRKHLPLLSEMADEVGDNQVRSMGTIGGVMAHADSAGDYPTLALMLDADVVTDRRSITASDFFQDVFTSALEADEVIREVVFPVAQGPHRYIKFRRRLIDWAIVGVAAQRLDDGWRIGLTNVGPTPVRAHAVEALLSSGASAEESSAKADEGLNPSADLRASADYKRHLARVLTQRALTLAQS